MYWLARVRRFLLLLLFVLVTKTIAQYFIAQFDIVVFMEKSIFKFEILYFDDIQIPLLNVYLMFIKQKTKPRKQKHC